MTPNTECENIRYSWDILSLYGTLAERQSTLLNREDASDANFESLSFVLFLGAGCNFESRLCTKKRGYTYCPRYLGSRRNISKSDFRQRMIENSNSYSDIPIGPQSLSQNTNNSILCTAPSLPTH